MAKILLDELHVIQEVDTDQEILLGHIPHHLVGRSARQFEGPLTDSAILDAAFEDARLRGLQSQFYCTLYGRGADAENFFATCEPHRYQTRLPNWTLLSLEPSQAVPLTAVFEEESQAWALLQTEWPHFVDIVNAVFTAQFGIAEDDIVGQNLHRIKPPHVLSAGLRRLLQVASAGYRSHEILTLCTAAGAEIEVEATCVPVVTPPSAAAECLFVCFSVPRPLGSGVCEAASSTA